MQEKILDSTYRLLQEVGRGGFGAVYRGVKIGAEGSGQVAIKLLNRNPKLSSEDYIRFQREATLMSQLVHPGIVSVLELSEDAGTYFIVMEFVSGLNLKDFVKSRGGKLSLVEIVDVLLQAAEALEYVHSHNIIHRDIKPQNMLLEEKNERGEQRNHVKLVDFGVARLGESSGTANTQTESVVGTYAYMAPEATGLTKWALDSRADVYSLGIVAYELVAGKTPFFDLRNDDLLRAHVEREPPPIQAIRGQSAPTVIEAIIRKCIAKDPQDRYQSMFGLVCDLRRIQVDLRTRGVVEEFPVGTKDIGIGKLLENVFVGREAIVSEAVNFLAESASRTGVVWAMLRADVGLGKSRCLQEVRRGAEKLGMKVLSLRFSETEQNLPLQALSLSINEYLHAWQRENRSEFRKFVGGVARGLGPMVDEIARLIPALRQFSGGKSQEPLVFDDGSSDLDGFQQESVDVVSFSKSLDRRYVAPNQRINDALLELIVSLLGGGPRLIFAMDDLHLADNSTISLFTYILEVNDRDLPFSFIFSMRDKTGRSNLILDHFIRRVSEAKEDLKVWTLLPFERNDVVAFFMRLGMANPSHEFVSYCIDKSSGSLFYLNTIVRQMLAQDVLEPVASRGTVGAQELLVHHEKLSQLSVDFVSIEILVASIDSLDRRDRALLRIAAVSYEACEFDYFFVEEEIPSAETEKRVLSLVRRGFFEMVGDEHAPLRRRGFVFSHEKIRNEVLSRLDLETRRKIHMLLGRCIESLYKNPRREQVLALAKHYDGAGEKNATSGAVKAFLRAAKVYLAGQEHNMARYYIDRALEVTGKISDRNEHLKRMRECYEAEYMIQAAQGNLVEASEVCRNLIEITYDSKKRETLQVFWSQLLIGLGRHQLAYDQAVEVLANRKLMVVSRLQRAAAVLVDFLIEYAIFERFFSLLRFFFRDSSEERELEEQLSLMMGFAHLHGGVSGFRQTLLMMARSAVFRGPVSKNNVVHRVMHANILLMRGQISSAYREHEECEFFLQSRGMKNQLRWAAALRAIWLDYPMGRMDRLLSLLDNEFGTSFPSSGVMHFEAYGMRAWLMLLSPSSRVARTASSSAEKRRRKSDRGAAAQKEGIREALQEGNVARRVMDSGENNQYTALALFADAMRFAFCDKIDPLKRATDLLRRQTSVSPIGDSLVDYAFAFQSLVLGHQHEALRFYQRGTQRVISMRAEVVSLVVSDALRFAAMMLPVMAVSFGARDWPWGTKLLNALTSLDSVLSSAEGRNNPRRSAMSRLFNGFLAALGAEQSRALALLERAVVESRTQRCDLLEAIALSLSAGFVAKRNKTKALENFREALKVVFNFELRLLERQIIGFSKAVNIDLSEAVHKREEEFYSTRMERERRTSLGLADLILEAPKLFKVGGIERVLQRTVETIMSSLNASGAVLFIENSENFQGRFVPLVRVGAVPTTEEDDRWILKLLPRTSGDPVRLLPMVSYDLSHKGQSFGSDPSICVQTSDDEATRAGVSVSSEETSATRAADITAARPTIGSRPRTDSADTRYLVLVGLLCEERVLGWIAVPNVETSSYSAREVEHDFILLGMHIGEFILRRGGWSRDEIIEGVARVAQGSSTGGVASAMVRGEVPRGVLVETHGRIRQDSQSGCRVLGVNPHALLAFRWEFESKSPVMSNKLGLFVSKHLEFVAASTSKCTEPLMVELLMLRIFSDLVTIFESFALESKFEALDMSVVVIDTETSRSVESDFGGGLLGFSGRGEVVGEYLQENSGIIDSDRLVYHERERCLSGNAGWIFSTSEKSKHIRSSFSQLGLLDSYFVKRALREPHLAEALGLPRNVVTSFVALLVPGREGAP